MSPFERRGSWQPTATQTSTPSKGRRATVPDLTPALPACAPVRALVPDNHRPFRFGAEFEVIIRPRDHLLRDKLVLPDFDANTHQQRNFNLALRRSFSTQQQSGLLVALGVSS